MVRSVCPLDIYKSWQEHVPIFHDKNVSSREFSFIFHAMRALKSIPLGSLLLMLTKHYAENISFLRLYFLAQIRQ